MASAAVAQADHQQLPRPPMPLKSPEAQADAGDTSRATSDEMEMKGGELMPFDDGSMTADRAQSSAMTLVVNYAEPPMAAGTAVFGLGLIVLPLLAKLNGLAGDDTFLYKQHGETNPKQPMRLFTETELRRRFGLLDAASVASEITMSPEELQEHIARMTADLLDEEVAQMQRWREAANSNLRSLQKRSALAFLGLPPDATEGDISKMYKKMALELHPDKGGDPEKFQELQEMKERLNELEKDEDENGKKDEDEDEEAKKAKEKEKEEAEKLPASERVKKLRTDVHDNAVRLWERARRAQQELGPGIKCTAQPALNILRLFVDRFVASEIKTLKHDDTRGAEAKLRKFLKQGAEILAVAALTDVQSTLSTLAMHFNYRLVARSGSVEIRQRCAALLEAVAAVPQQAEDFLRNLEHAVADQKERDKNSKEAKAREQRDREARGDYSGEAGKSQASGPSAYMQQPQSNSSAKATADSGAGAKAADPFAGFAFGGEKAKQVESRKPPEADTAVLANLRSSETSSSQVAAAVAEQKRTGWDPNFDHPYAGALKSNGTGVYCRPCQRWIVTYEYNVEVFYKHAERVHPKPPPGWA